MSGIEIENNSIRLDIDYVLQAMTSEDKAAFIKSFACQSDVVDHVIKYICGEDPDGWWASNDDSLRMKILTQVEDSHIKNWSKYSWGMVREATSKLQAIREKQHIYWSLYHAEVACKVILPNGKTKHFASFITDWMKANGVESDYTSKQGDADVQKVLDIVTEAMDGLKKEKNL